METGTWLLRRPTTAEIMVKLTEQGGGSDVPEAERTVEITIQDVFRHIATVKVVSRDMLDYLHLVKLNDQWFIINALWELRAGEIKTGFEEMKEMVGESSDQLREAAEQLNGARVKWEEMLNSLGDDPQLANVDLQNMLQKQGQTLQMMSNISKMLYDTANAVIRKMGG
jgi:Putative lumazine-binding